MKYFVLTAFITLLSILSFAQNQEMHRNDDVANIIIDFDAACMQKFDYVTDYEYIVEESYTTYHMRLDETKTFIVKVNSSSQPMTMAEQGIKKSFDLTCSNVSQIIDRWFIYRLNHGGSNVFIKSGNTIYKATYCIYREMNDDHMSYYAPPYSSFKYEYTTDHYPATSIPTEQEDDHSLFDVTYLLHGKTEEKGMRKDVFLKIYNETCYGRDFGITTPLSPVGEANPFLAPSTPVNNGAVAKQKTVFRSCQHPIQTEIIKGIGLYKESYKEFDNVYVSKLVAVDNIPVDQYLEQVASGLKEEVPHEQFLETQPTEYYFAMRGNENSPIQPVNSSDTDEEGLPFLVKKPANKVTARTDAHIVQKGDTLFNISKRYNTTVDKIKILNELETDTIGIGQELKIPN